MPYRHLYRVVPKLYNPMKDQYFVAEENDPNIALYSVEERQDDGTHQVIADFTDITKAEAYRDWLGVGGGKHKGVHHLPNEIREQAETDYAGSEVRYEVYRDHVESKEVLYSDVSFSNAVAYLKSHEEAGGILMAVVDKLMPVQQDAIDMEWRKLNNPEDYE